MSASSTIHCLVLNTMSALLSTWQMFIVESRVLSGKVDYFRHEVKPNVTKRLCSSASTNVVGKRGEGVFS